MLFNKIKILHNVTILGFIENESPKDVNEISEV